MLVGGLRPTVVTLVGYDDAWPARFEVERRRIEAVLDRRALGVHHIGSTSVPGLAAMDRVDVCLEVADPEDEAAWLPDLLGAGWVVRVVEPGHRCLVRADEVEPASNLHVYRVGAPEVTDYVLLRERLRSCAADRGLYERTKRGLAGREWSDVNHYADAKGPVIRAILARARAADG